MSEKNLTNNKINLFFIFIIILLTISIVPKTFQNDTFFNISIGKYILEHGIDMKDHFSWITGLDYTYSHWAFDIIIYLIYSKLNFLGIYIFTVIFAILINVLLFCFLNKLYKNPFVSLFSTIVTAFLNMGFYAARSQIVSFLCFIIEIYCIEKYIDTDNKKYAFTILLIGIIIANFHAATWPLVLVLFLPYIVASFFNFLSEKNIYTKLKKHSEKKLKKNYKEASKYKKIEDDIKTYEKIIEKSKNVENYKIIKKQNYNTKHLFILMILTILTGFITPIHNVPFTYIINSMFGYSNFGMQKSIYYVNEMKPIIPAVNIQFLIFTIILIEFLFLLPTKLKLEHGFLILGLFIMTIASARYIALLIFIGSFILSDLITQSFNLYVVTNLEPAKRFFTLTPIILLISITCSIYTFSKVLDKRNIKYVDPKLYPTNAVTYILENIDYKNMRIFNNYSFGSYLMLNNIPVFIDSRLDVYCSEFNNTDIFYDFISILTFSNYYETIFSKYDFTHILIKNDEYITKYLEQDTNYNKIYEDTYFTLFERNLT